MSRYDLLLVQYSSSFKFIKGDNMTWGITSKTTDYRPFYLKLYWERK